MLEKTTRDLNKTERRWTSKELNLGRKRLHRFFLFSACSSVVVAVIGGLLSIGQFRESQALGWLALGTTAIYIVIVWAVYFQNRAADVHRLDQLEAVLERGVSRTTRCCSQQVAEAEEIEDEGATFFFQVEPDKIFVLSGQQYYATRRFPNSDFEIVEVWCDGTPVQFSIACHGEKLRPQVRLSKASKEALLEKDCYPEDFDLIEGRIERLEEALLARAGV